MVVTSTKESPRMAWMSLARPRPDDEIYWGSSASPVGLASVECARETRIEWSMAFTKEVAVRESTAILDFHPSRMGSSIGYRKRETLEGLANGGVNASVVRIGRFKVPRTPRWSQKAVRTVVVSSVWREMRWGSHIVRWSVYDA